MAWNRGSDENKSVCRGQFELLYAVYALIHYSCSE